MLSMLKMFREQLDGKNLWNCLQGQHHTSFEDKYVPSCKLRLDTPSCKEHTFPKKNMTFLKSSLPHFCQWYIVTKPSTLTQDLQPSTLLAEYHSINNHVILQDSSDYVSEPRSNSDRKDYIPISIYHDSYNYEPNPDFIKFPTKWPEVGRWV